MHTFPQIEQRHDSLIQADQRPVTGLSNITAIHPHTLTHSHTHSHSHSHASVTSHHEDLDLILLVWSVEEGNAGVLSQEVRHPLGSVRVLDFVQQLHDLLGCAVLFGRQRLGVGRR